MAINADFNGADEVIPTTPLPPAMQHCFSGSLGALGLLAAAGNAAAIAA
jgi:hypothetical protein